MKKKLWNKNIRFFALYLGATTLLFGTVLCAEEPIAPDKDDVQSLEALFEAIQDKNKALAELQPPSVATTNEVAEKKEEKKVDFMQKELVEMNQKLEKYATTVDPHLFIEKEPVKIDLQAELMKFAEPILAEIKGATTKTREISDLRANAEKLSKKKEAAGKAVKTLEALLQKNISEDLKVYLSGLLDEWKKRLEDSTNQEKAVALQLKNHMENKPTFMESIKGILHGFLGKRGAGLFLGILTFCGVYFPLRFLEGIYSSLRASKKRRSFLSRLLRLLYRLFCVVTALFATILVFSLRGEMFLLTILVLILIGVIWSAVKTLPQHIETIKLMLNLGSVKEGERIVFDGVPWKVESLSLGVKLLNPLLEGGELNLPVAHLLGHHSRPCGKTEGWFPCEKDQWVELSNGQLGKVQCQTPSTVQLSEFGGSVITYQTPEFLGMNPRNLSVGTRVKTIFQIDYEHQEIATTEIPEKMQAALETGIPEVIDADQILSISVIYSEAAASSLNYLILINLKGESAEKRGSVQFAVHRILLDLCTANQWTIPFQQIVVHKG